MSTSFAHADRIGPNAVTSSGTIGHRRLAPGRYVLQLTPRASGRTGRTVVARVTMR
jgi:hypothetical protein